MYFKHIKHIKKQTNKLYKKANDDIHGSKFDDDIQCGKLPFKEGGRPKFWLNIHELNLYVQEVQFFVIAPKTMIRGDKGERVGSVIG